MKKIIYTSFLIFTIFIGLNVSASTTSDKDNVLISAEGTGIGTTRGYDLLWKSEGITGTYPQESAVIKKDDIVYVTSLNLTNTVEGNYPGNNSLFALDATTGEIIEQLEIGPSFGDVRVEGNTLYIGTGDEFWNEDTEWTGDFGVYSFDISDVRNNGFVQNWFKSVPEGVTTKLMIDDSNIYFLEFFALDWSLQEGKNLRAINKFNGNDVWSFEKGSGGVVYSLLQGDYIYLTNSYAGSNTMYKINKIDGTQVWQQPIVGKLWDNSITYSPEQDALFLTAYYDKDFYEYDSDTDTAFGHSRAVSYDMMGEERWSKDLHDLSLSYTSYHDNSVFFADLSGWIYSFDADTGDLEWEIQIGKGVHQSVDIASPVIANGYVFVGTKGDEYPIDSIGRGAFYILDEETGDIVWTYQEDDLGDVMALATVTGGVFYNVTSAWDVYAFDVGDGTTSDHTNSTYDTNNTFSTETGLTVNKYLELECSATRIMGPGQVNRCDLTNTYSGKAIEVKLDFDENIYSVGMPNGNYDIYVDGSRFYANLLNAENTENYIISFYDTYNSTLPRLINVNQTNAVVSGASYQSSNTNITLTIDNTTAFGGEIETFSKPFINATSTLNGSSVIVSKTGMVDTTEIISADMTFSDFTGNIETEVPYWSNVNMQWTEKPSGSTTSVNHIITQLIPKAKYILTIDGSTQSVSASDIGTLDFQTVLVSEVLKSFSLERV